MLLVVLGCARQTYSPVRPLLESPPPFSQSGDAGASSRWWTAFGIPELDAGIDAALQSNYPRLTALERVRAARAVARREASDFFPDVNGVFTTAGDMGPGENRTSYVLGFDTSYQVDLWGEIESRVDAAQLRADATCFDSQAITLGLSAEVARVWFSLIEANAQAELLQEQIENNRIGLQLQRQRFGEGLIRSPDVLRQQQLLESTLEAAAVAESRIRVLEHQLAILLGEMPQTARYDTGSQLPELPPLPATGIPSELVQRRPDVRRDFRALQAADRDLASAISNQYPRLSLTGSLLSVADEPETIFRDWFLSLGSQLIAPLLDGGQRRAEVLRTCAVKQQRLYEYAQTILIAFREVEDSLVQEKYQRERMEHLKEQVRLAKQSSVQLREQYLIGDAEYLDVLSASTSQQSLQRQLLSAQLDLVLIRVSLYLALAGSIDAAVDRLQYIEVVPDVELLPEPAAATDAALLAKSAVTTGTAVITGTADRTRTADPNESFDNPTPEMPQFTEEETAETNADE